MEIRFILEEMSAENRCSVLDTKSNLRCIWEKRNYQNTKEFIYQESDSKELCKSMEEMSEWIEKTLLDLV